MILEKSVLLHTPNPDGTDGDCTASLTAAIGGIEPPMTAPQTPPGTSGSYLHVLKDV